MAVYDIFITEHDGALIVLSIITDVSDEVQSIQVDNDATNPLVAYVEVVTPTSQTLVGETIIDPGITSWNVPGGYFYTDPSDLDGFDFWWAVGPGG